MCVSANKMKNTIVMRRTYLHYIKKYNRFEKRHTNVGLGRNVSIRGNVVCGREREGREQPKYGLFSSPHHHHKHIVLAGTTRTVEEVF